MTNTTVHAQSPWLSPYEPSLLSVEIAKPNLRASLGTNNDERLSFLSAAVFLTGRYALNKHLRLITELPISHWEYNDTDDLRSHNAHTTLGNLYLGVELHNLLVRDRLHPFLELGVRLPTLPEPDFPDKQGYFTGLLAAQERADAFTTDFLPIQAITNVVYDVDPMFSLRLRGGPSYLIHVGEEPSLVVAGEGEKITFKIDNELYLLYAGQLWFRSQSATASFGMTGRFWATEEEGDFFDRSVHQLSVHVTGHFGRLLPGAYLRVPIDDGFGYFVTGVYGLTLGIELP